MHTKREKEIRKRKLEQNGKWIEKKHWTKQQQEQEFQLRMKKLKGNG